MKPVRVGMLGFGTVGTGTFRMLEDNRESIERRVGAPVQITKIGIRDKEKPRSAPADLFTTDLDSIVADPDIDVVIEVMGGVDPAGRLMRHALEAGKHVVTANKELIAKEGAALIRQAASKGLDLHFEAAVGGGIPLIQPLKHQLAGNDVLRLMGIVNGTTNYILTRMTEAGMTRDQALEEAKALGYAEPDPTADVDGYDAQYKAAILASLAFSAQVPPDQVYREGIMQVEAEDIHFAQLLGCRIKLLAIAETLPEGLLVRVHPTLLPRKHPLANVHDVFNAVLIRGDFVGDIILSGRGAGSEPTASAVVGDLIDVCRNMRLGGAGNAYSGEGIAQFAPMEELRSRFYLRMEVSDQPKVLGQIATVLGDFDVSLAAMEMKVLDAGQRLGQIVFLTHICREGDFRQAVNALQSTNVVHRINSTFRVEEMP